MRELFAGWFDYYAERASDRLDGLTDEEYLWEPAPNSWSVRAQGDKYVIDWAWPDPEPAPITTIGWRLVHICSVLREHGLRPVAFEKGKANHVEPSEVPATAADGMALFARAIASWKHDLDSVSEDRLLETLGPEADAFADDPVVAFVEHIHDEFIHHTAEISLLRDLYRARTHPLG